MTHPPQPVQFATAFSGADAVAACVHRHPEHFGHWRQAWAAELTREEAKAAGCSGGVVSNAGYACSVLTRRCPCPNLGDITRVVRERRMPDGRVDVLVMGPPCTDYSKAGGQKGPKGNVAPLSIDAAEITLAARAEVAVIENSPEWQRKFPDFYESVMRIPAATHSHRSGTMTPQMFGMPVNRERTYVVLVRNDEGQLDQIMSGWPPKRSIDPAVFDWGRILEPVADLRRQGRMKRHGRGGGLVVSNSQAAHILGRKGDGGVDERAERAFERAMRDSFDEDADLEDLGAAEMLFWDDEFHLKAHPRLATLMKSSGLSRGTFFRADGFWWPRFLTAAECERAQGFPGAWTDVPHIHSKKRSPLSENMRMGLMGNSMSVQCLRFLLSRIDIVMQPLWQRRRAMGLGID